MMWFVHLKGATDFDGPLSAIHEYLYNCKKSKLAIFVTQKKCLTPVINIIIQVKEIHLT